MEHLPFQPSWVLNWLLESTICISILICLILIIKAVAKGKFPAWWSYGLWLLLLFRMLIPLEIESRVSIFNFLPVPLENESHIPFLMENDLSISLIQDNFDTSGIITAPASTDTGLIKEPANHYYDNYDSKESTGYNFNLSLGNAFLVLWLTGVMFFGTKILFKNIMFWFLIRRLPSVKDKMFLDLFKKCRVSLAVQKSINVIVTGRVKSPALFGYFKPRLLLPPHFLETLQKDELRYVFLHELSHLKRHDIAISWLVAVLQIVYWFNPLVWYAFHHLRIDQEAACDAYVLSRTKQVQPGDYANTIVSLLERFIQNRQLPSLAGIIENRSQIRKRIVMIMNFKKYTIYGKCVSALLFFMVGLIFFTGSSGKADVKKQENGVNSKEIQLIESIDKPAISGNENQVSSPEIKKEFGEETDIVQSGEMVKNPMRNETVKITGVKEGAEIKLAGIETKKDENQADPLVLAANKKQEVLSKNNTPDIEAPEQSMELSGAVQERQDPSIDYTHRGLSNLEKDRIYDAVSDFNKAIEINPGNSVAFYSRGRAFFRHGKTDKAISDYNKAIEISPEFTAAYQDRGYAYYSIGEIDKAISDYNRAIEIDPEDAAVYNMRGISYFKQGEIGKAISDYSRAIEINPRFDAAYLNRGYSYHAEKNYNKAISDYTKVIQINPEDAVAYRIRGYSYHSNGKFQNAVSDYSRAIELNSGNVNAYFTRGLVYSAMGKFREARSDFEKVIEMNPEAAIANSARKYKKITFRSGMDYHIPMGSSGVNIDHNDMGSAFQQARSISVAPPTKIER